MKSHLKYLILSSILIIFCFLIVPLIFFYQERDIENSKSVWIEKAIELESSNGDDDDMAYVSTSNSECYFFNQFPCCIYESLLMSTW